MGLASIAALAEGRPNADDDKAQRLIASPRPQDQSNAKTDRELAAAVRQAIARDKSLSTYAHKVRFIVKDGSLHIARTIGARSAVEIIHCCDLCRQLLFGTVLACANGTLR
jgi:hypothetical protein